LSSQNAEETVVRFADHLTPAQAAPVPRWRRIPHSDVVVSSGSLFGSTIVTSVLGFAYWSLTARSAPAAAVGTASTLVSALTLLGTVGMFGIGTMLIAELSRQPGRARDLLPVSLLVVGLMSGCLAAVFAAGSHLFGASVTEALGSPADLALFVGGVVLSAVTLVFDEASLGLQVAPVQLWRNAVFAATKIALIPVIVLAGGPAWSILATWVLGLVVSAIAVIPLLRRHRLLPTRRPSLSALRGLGWAAAHHNTLNLSLSVPRMAVPVLVGLFQPGTTTAAFYAAWMIASFLYSIPTHLSTSLFAIAAGDVRALRSKVRMTLSLSFWIGLAAVPTMTALATPLMMIFGREYANAGARCLMVLVLLYPAQVIKQHYAAILRANGRIRRAGVVCSVAAVAELLAIVTVAARADITTIATAQGVVLLAGALYMLPAVVRALWSSEPAGHSV
jgi:O-antigen/teichoic acid export membrane protein